MSIPSYPEALARIRADAEVLLAQTAAHEHHLEALVHTTESEMRWAEAAVSGSIGRAELALELANLLRWQLRRTVDAASAAKRLCVEAREQHDVAARLLALCNGDESANEHCSARCRPEMVLVVDDNGEIRQLVSEVLQAAGFVVRTAANGLEALLAAYEMQPAVIVMDLTMPVLDGIEATRLIKATRATRSARVIAYTGKSTLEQGVVDELFVAVLPKSADPAAVLSTVHQAVGV